MSRKKLLIMMYRLIFMSASFLCAQEYDVHEQYITNKNGLRLYSIFVEPKKRLPEKPVIIWLHGLQQHTRRDIPVMAAMARQGFASIGFDIVGHGRSEGERSLIQDKYDLVQDLELVYAYYKSAITGPLFVVGHSMGAGIIIGYLQCSSIAMPIRAAIALSPAVAFKKGIFPRYKRALVGMVASLIPGAYINYCQDEIESSWNTRDTAMVQEDEQDPHILKVLHLQTLLTGLDCFDLLARGRGKALAPLHILAAGDERVVDLEATKRLYSCLPDSVDHSLVIFPEMRHTLLRDIGREDVVASLAALLMQYI